MPKNSKVTPRVRETISASQIESGLKTILSFLYQKFGSDLEDVALVGIQTRGVTLAERLARLIESQKNIKVPVGSLDITLYRDDFSTSGIQTIVGETNLNFNLDDKKIVLIDDVLFTGRTIRAALDELMDFGRPKSIALVALIDRGHRELPIQADCAPITLETKRDESIHVHLQENDGKEEILICEPLDGGA